MSMSSFDFFIVLLSTDVGETIPEAGLREVLEETGINSNQHPQVATFKALDYSEHKFKSHLPIVQINLN